MRIAPTPFVAALLAAALLNPAIAGAARSGDLDPSFGGDGKVDACGGRGGHFAPIAIDAHNRIVSGGDCLDRTLPSGRPDRAFGYNGFGGHALAFDGHLVKGKITGTIHVNDNVLYSRAKHIYRKVSKITGDTTKGRTIHF